jgi:RimJ/RimL family protein N-acetyltransferase
MSFELQPQLRNSTVSLEPLRADDFEALYAVASDPLIWEQHPNRNRYRREVFQTYFQGALESGSAFRVSNALSGELIGCSRYYDIDPVKREAAIGYTFLARSVWGLKFNAALKQLMLDHAFRFVDRVIFHIGVDNLRSRKALEKLGGILIGEEAIAYYGEPSKMNAVYKIDKADWASAP